MPVLENYEALKTACPIPRDRLIQFRCSVCHCACDLNDPYASGHRSVAAGYDLDAAKALVCYPCRSEADKASMRTTGKAVLYLTHPPIARGTQYPFADGHVSNWPGSFQLPCRVKRGYHNIAGSRYDVWFRFEGTEWHGVQYGENTQLCHCKAIKGSK